MQNYHIDVILPEDFADFATMLIEAEGEPWCKNQIGSASYWKDNEKYWIQDGPKDGLFALSGRYVDNKDENKIDGFVVVQPGFRCEQDKQDKLHFKCDNNHPDSWYIDLICSSAPGLGLQMITKLKTMGRESDIKFISLAATESVITYYWDKADFIISTTCLQNPKFLQILKNLKSLLTKKRELQKEQKKIKDSIKEQEKKYRDDRVPRKQRKSHEEEYEQINGLTKGIKRLDLDKFAELLGLVQSGMYIRNMKRSGSLNPFHAKWNDQLLEEFKDGVYMTFCLDQKDNEKIEFHAGDKRKRLSGM